MSNPVSAAAIGLPDPHLSAALPPVGFPLSLTALSIDNLAALHNALTLVSDTYTGFLNQPRCKDRAAIDILEDEADRASTMSVAVVHEMRRRVPQTLMERDTRARLLVSVAADSDDWAAAARLLGELLAMQNLPIGGAA